VTERDSKASNPKIAALPSSMGIKMRGSIGLWLQSAVVILLFFASLGVLGYLLFAAIDLPRQERFSRESVRQAGERMAAAARRLERHDVASKEFDAQLRHVAGEALAESTGVEGGYFLAESNSFVGFAYPTDPLRRDDDVQRNEPPPLELRPILSQVQESLDRDMVLLRTMDVGPSRVIILSQPVDEKWPSSAAVWAMRRLTGPERLESQLRLTGIAAVLALGGIGLALLLAANLGRSLARQRREQQRLREELRRAERLATLGRLLAGVAHEVRNPLAAIRSTVQLWQRQPETARVETSMESVIQAVDRLNELVVRLLLFSRADNSQREPVDLNAIFAESCDLLAAQAEQQRVVIERDLANALPAVSASPNAIRQLVLNLLTNALQAMPTGGRLKCRTRHVGSRVEGRVADTGPGVSEAAREHLFEPFFTTRTTGTGLGLALCREILGSHDGSIELTDAKDEGTVGAEFRFEIPVRA
jgi:two-component system sensor histidine kinase HydH